MIILDICTIGNQFFQLAWTDLIPNTLGGIFCLPFNYTRGQNSIFLKCKMTAVLDLINAIVTLMVNSQIYRK